MIELGKKAKDKITGFEGILVTRAQYITGCDQYAICPKAKDGEIFDYQYFDESRIKVTGDGVKIEDVAFKKDPGGLNRDQPKK